MGVVQRKLGCIALRGRLGCIEGSVLLRGSVTQSRSYAINGDRDRWNGRYAVRSVELKKGY